MSAEQLRVLSSLIVTVLLIALIAYLQTYVPGVTADNLAIFLSGAVVTKWLQSSDKAAAAQQTAVLQEVAKTALTKVPEPVNGKAAA
jgi:hypothetical protein